MDLATMQRTDVEQLLKETTKGTGIVHQLLESCTTAEVCEALGESYKLLNQQRNKLRDWLTLQPHLPQGLHFTFSVVLFWSFWD